MGTSFDFMDEASHTTSPLVNKTQKENRLYLRSLMNKNGFQGISREWWHFTLKNEPFPTTFFDFTIK
jgi:D-alanyl-D-alanine dipeptidase